MSIAVTEAQRGLRRAALKRMRAKRREAGLCIQCEAASPKHVRCLDCRIAANRLNWIARHGVENISEAPGGAC